jgi:PAS domain S-box-containing protein
MPTKLENLGFKTVAKQMLEAVVLADEKGHITWVNSAFEKLCGYAPTEILGNRPGDFLQGKDTDRKTVREFRVAVKAGLGIQADILNYHKDGHSYWARVSITPLRNATGSLQGFIAIERDVTAEHQNFKQLRGEVVELYSTILFEEELQGLELESGDPFRRRAIR